MVVSSPSVAARVVPLRGGCAAVIHNRGKSTARTRGLHPRQVAHTHRQSVTGKGISYSAAASWPRFPFVVSRGAGSSDPGPEVLSSRYPLQGHHSVRKGPSAVLCPSPVTPASLTPSLHTLSPITCAGTLPLRAQRLCDLPVQLTWLARHRHVKGPSRNSRIVCGGLTYPCEFHRGTRSLAPGRIRYRLSPDSLCGRRSSQRQTDLRLGRRGSGPQRHMTAITASCTPHRHAQNGCLDHNSGGGYVFKLFAT